MLDGQIRELDQPFEVNGMEAMYPGDFREAGEDINCRCVMLTRARWALDQSSTKWDNLNGELIRIDARGFDEFREEYEGIVGRLNTTDYLGNSRYMNVTDEYISNASPGTGEISYSEGYKEGRHRVEINTARNVQKTLGGDFIMINESNIKTPDCFWNGNMWRSRLSMETIRTTSSGKRWCR